MSILAIDFGTSFCTASWVNPKTGQPEAIMFPNAVDVYKIPSVVMYPEKGNPIVGTPAYLQIENAASTASIDTIQECTITSIKRKMKRDGNFLGHSHQEIISLILQYVTEQAQKACNFPEPPDRLVLTHPVIFEEWKKEMLKEAAIQAGYSSNNILMIAEPIAAALEYIRSNPQAQVKGLLVYDFGGGTFDVAYVQIDHHGKPYIPIETTEGEPFCGGDDIDLLIYDNWERLAKQQNKRSISANSQEADTAFLLQCRKQKELLSATSENTFRIILPPIQGRGLDRCEWRTNKAEYDAIIEPIINVTISKTSTVLEKIRQKKMPLDAVLLIGGSSRIPLVEQRLSELLHGEIPIRTTGKVDTAVSLGAVSYANNIFNFDKNRDKKNTCYCMYCGSKMSALGDFCMNCGKKRDIDLWNQIIQSI